MANPQLEDGFMRVANGIVDNICKLSLNGTEQKVIWCVIRYTYGFNRRSHCLSASFISQWANCDISSVKRALRHLQKMNIIVCINADKRGVTAELKFNKNYDQWKLTGGRNDTTIQKLVEYAKGQGSSHAEMLYMTYTRLANKMAGINKRDEATVMQLNNLSLMENIILHEVDLGIMQGKHYQGIYRDCKKRLETVKDLAYLEAV